MLKLSHCLSFRDLFRFRPYGNASRQALQKVRQGGRAVRVSVHLRHREACQSGEELLTPVVNAVRQLVAGRRCQVLVASDRRHALQLLTPLVAPCEVISVERGIGFSRGRFVENGVDAGETAAADIELLARGDHLVGTFGSTFTLLIQALIAHRYVTSRPVPYRKGGDDGTYGASGVRTTPGSTGFQGDAGEAQGGAGSRALHGTANNVPSVDEPCIVMCEVGGCMKHAMPLIADWHLSLSQWPLASLWVGVASSTKDESRKV